MQQWQWNQIHLPPQLPQAFKMLSKITSSKRIRMALRAYYNQTNPKTKTGFSLTKGVISYQYHQKLSPTPILSLQNPLHSIAGRLVKLRRSLCTAPPC